MSETTTDAAAGATATAAATTTDTAAATAATAAAPGTALAAGGQETQRAPVPATWPEDWKQRVAGDDAKELKRLERFGSPADLYKSYRAAEQKIASGEYRRSEPGADAKPEEIAAWRKEVGVPDAPAGYLEKLPDGITVGDGEKPLVEAFVAKMHETGAPPKYVHAALQAYYQQIDLVNQERAEADQASRQAAEDTLRAEWGNEYRANTNAIVGTLGAVFGNDVVESLINARLPDGTAVGNSPALLKGLLQIAKDVNPAATIVPGTGGNAGAGIDERITQIEGMMRDPKSGYFKNEKVQAEYRQLLDARDRQKKRAA